MNLVVVRKVYTAKSTTGELYLPDGTSFYTLEPPARAEKPCAIPAGIYELTMRYSPKHHGNVPHVEQVPGFTDIEIHVGNYPEDTEGCLLVGKFRELDFVGSSKQAFDELCEKLTANPTEMHHILYEDTQA